MRFADTELSPGSLLVTESQTLESCLLTSSPSPASLPHCYSAHKAMNQMSCVSKQDESKERSTKGNGKNKLHCLLDINNCIQLHPYLIILSYTAEEIQITGHSFINTAPTYSAQHSSWKLQPKTFYSIRGINNSREGERRREPVP